MPQVDLAHKHSKKPMIVAVVASVVAVLVIATVVILMSLPKTPKQDTKVVMSNARDKAFAGKDDEAIALLKQQITQTKNKDEKLALNMQLGATYENKGDNKAALEAYQAADAITSGFGTTQSVARLAEAVGDKALALKSYEKCRDILKEGKSNQNIDFLPGIEESIKRLGASS